MHVPVVQAFAVADVFHEAVAGGVEHREALLEMVAEGEVQRALDAGVAVVPGGGVEVAAVFVLRLLGDDIHHPGGGVPAVQGALRAAQHFHPLGVEILGFEDAGVGEIGAVVVSAHAHIPGGADGEVAHAADADEGGGEEIAGHQHVGDGELDVQIVVDLGLVQVILRKGADRDGGILQGGLPLLRRHNHLFEEAALRGGCGRGEGAGEGQDEGRAGREVAGVIGPPAGKEGRGRVGMGACGHGKPLWSV